MTKPRNPARFRLDFIKENTFNRLWSVRLTRGRVVAVSIVIFAAGLALVWAVFAFTPLRQLLPGALRGDLRTKYVDAALRLDSLENAARINAAYLGSIVRAVQGDTTSATHATSVPATVADSLLAASEAERLFVKKFEDEERFNLSVLAPIAADGMIFSPPSSSIGEVNEIASSQGIRIYTTRRGAINAVYRGTVIASDYNEAGLSTVTIQHPNDFVSIISGAAEVIVDKGDKVVAGQRIGSTDVSGVFMFELWHKGSALEPAEYIPLQ